MALTPRVKKYTDYGYLITNPASENDVRSQMDGALQEVFDNADAAISAIPNNNLLINGNFDINQRVVSGTVVLTAGKYGHDRFKAGSGGCTYTFSTSLGVTTLNISAGTLQQVVEGFNVRSGQHILSWVGTSTGKIGAGSFGASGVIGTLVGGTNCTVEFSTGTLSKVKLEVGSVATDFIPNKYVDELNACMNTTLIIPINVLDVIGYVTTSLNIVAIINLTTPLRANPTVALGGTILLQHLGAIYTKTVSSVVSTALKNGSTCVIVEFSVTDTGGLIAHNSTRILNNSNAVFIDAEL